MSSEHEKRPERRAAVRVFTTSEAAERFGVHPSTLSQWIKQGLVRAAHTFGGHARITEEEVTRVTDLLKGGGTLE